MTVAPHPQRVFVAGATGVLGRRAVAQLVAAGHRVTGVARTPEKAALLRSLGATPVTVDLFDATAVRRAVAGHDVVMNLATHIPPLSQAAVPGAWAENDRIRREASRNLVDAAIAVGATRYVQESIAFIVADGGSEWLDEDSPLDTPSFTKSVLDAEGQAARFTEQGGTGVVLRFGQFMAADSSHSQSQARMVGARVAPFPGDPDSYAPIIHADDAAAAVVASLRAPAGTYLVVDDEPMTRGELCAAIAEAIGCRRPVHVPPAALKLGGSKPSLLMRSQRMRNTRFKEATGWAPSFRSGRETWAEVAASLPALPSVWRTGLVKAALAISALTAVVLGLWATFDPQGFYDSFPGGGRAWVAADGPYNEHLVRDFGGLQLALAIITGTALVRFTSTLVRVAGAATLAFGIPHLVYHLRHLDTYTGFDRTMNAVSLSGAVVLGIVVLVLAGSATRPAGDGGATSAPVPRSPAAPAPSPAPVP